MTYYHLYVILDVLSRYVVRRMIAPRESAELAKTHSRPCTSNDNPHSEGRFRTMKYRPDFPDRFGGPEDSHAFCQRFSPWYNNDHRHSSIGMLTPAMVHLGRAPVIREKRQNVLKAAYLAHQDRFVRKPPTPLPLPEEVWIDKPPNSYK